ncbi:glycine hydroxymethyltransferase [Sarracenia purpurea var. burkii]
MVGLGRKAKVVTTDSPNKSPDVCSATSITPSLYTATTPNFLLSVTDQRSTVSKYQEGPGTTSNEMHRFKLSHKSSKELSSKEDSRARKSPPLGISSHTQGSGVLQKRASIEPKGLELLRSVKPAKGDQPLYVADNDIFMIMEKEKQRQLVRIGLMPSENLVCRAVMDEIARLIFLAKRCQESSEESRNGRHHHREASGNLSSIRSPQGKTTASASLNADPPVVPLKAVHILTVSLIFFVPYL